MNDIARNLATPHVQYYGDNVGFKIVKADTYCFQESNDNSDFVTLTTTTTDQPVRLTSDIYVLPFYIDPTTFRVTTNCPVHLLLDHMADVRKQLAAQPFQLPSTSDRISQSEKSKNSLTIENQSFIMRQWIRHTFRRYHAFQMTTKTLCVFTPSVIVQRPPGPINHHAYPTQTKRFITLRERDAFMHKYQILGIDVQQLPVYYTTPDLPIEYQDKNDVYYEARVYDATKQTNSFSRASISTPGRVVPWTFIIACDENMMFAHKFVHYLDTSETCHVMESHIRDVYLKMCKCAHQYMESETLIVAWLRHTFPGFIGMACADGTMLLFYRAFTDIPLAATIHTATRPFERRVAKHMENVQIPPLSRALLQHSDWLQTFDAAVEHKRDLFPQPPHERTDLNDDAIQAGSQLYAMATLYHSISNMQHKVNELHEQMVSDVPRDSLFVTGARRPPLTGAEAYRFWTHIRESNANFEATLKSINEKDQSNVERLQLMRTLHCRMQFATALCTLYQDHSKTK